LEESQRFGVGLADLLTGVLSYFRQGHLFVPSS
jgi:hypothetical protein